jgi:hypothetical protein
VAVVAVVTKLAGPICFEVATNGLRRRTGIALLMIVVTPPTATVRLTIIARSFVTIITVGAELARSICFEVTTKGLGRTVTSTRRVPAFIASRKNRAGRTALRRRAVGGRRGAGVSIRTLSTVLALSQTIETARDLLEANSLGPTHRARRRDFSRHGLRRCERRSRREWEGRRRRHHGLGTTRTARYGPEIRLLLLEQEDVLVDGESMPESTCFALHTLILSQHLAEWDVPIGLGVCELAPMGYDVGNIWNGLWGAGDFGIDSGLTPGC